MPSDNPRVSCKKCGKTTKKLDAICRSCAPIQAKRPEHPCKKCGATTTAQDKVCRPCRKPGHGARPQGARASGGALRPADGAWVNVRGVMRWVRHDEKEKVA